MIVAKQKYGEQLLISSGSNPYLSLQKGREKPAVRILELMMTMAEARLKGLSKAE